MARRGVTAPEILKHLIYLSMENYFIVRTDRAGVFFGKIKSKTSESVVMTSVRKIFYWTGASAVEQIAVDGINAENSKVTITIDEMEIAHPIQIIPCSEKSSKCLMEVKEWKQ